MRSDTGRVSAPGPARITALSLEALTAVGAVAGVQGFLSGTFDRHHFVGIGVVQVVSASSWRRLARRRDAA